VSGPNASLVLKTKIGLALGSVGDVHGRFWGRDDAASLFPSLLVQTYDLARASIPLMQTASGRCETLVASTGDGVAAGLLPFLAQHIEEERNHDAWLLDDLEVLGRPRAEVLDRSPSATAARLVGAQYYWILHDHPVALVGYMAALEGGVASESFLRDFATRAGIDPAGVRTLLLHARVDPYHEADLDALLDGLPLSSRQAALVATSALQTVFLLAELTQDVLNAADARAASGAAVSPA
jgi:hypothetical protein